MLYDLPFRSEDFEVDEYVCWMADMHSGAPTSIQTWGYDLGGVKLRNHSWSECDDLTVFVMPEASAGEDELRLKRKEWNELWHLYGKPIYAMRAGTVIAGWRNAPENGIRDGIDGYHPKVGTPTSPSTWVYGGGNGVWIQHDDGSLAEYAHMIPGSVPSDLVPHDDEFLPVQASSTDVTACWNQIYIPPAQQVKVEQGQFLGRVGSVGTSGHPHLHVHVESGSVVTAISKVPGVAQQMQFKRGLGSLNVEDPEWSPFAGSPIPHGPGGRLIWPPEGVGWEYAHHGKHVETFNELFAHLGDSGYELSWIDTYSVGGSIFVNHVWHPVTGNWRAHVLQDLDTHEKNIEAAKADDHHPVLIETCVASSQVWYSAILRELPGEEQILEHGVTYERLKQLMNDAVEKVVSPVSVAVTSVDGERRYSVLFRPVDMGRWVIKSAVHEKDFQDEFDRQDAEKRWPVYMCGYMHEGEPYLSVVFAERPAGNSHVDFAMDSVEYQKNYEAYTGDGMVTAMVTAFDGAKTTHRWAARWWIP
jgi:hypothetical protein